MPQPQHQHNNNLTQAQVNLAPPLIFSDFVRDDLGVRIRRISASQRQRIELLWWHLDPTCESEESRVRTAAPEGGLLRLKYGGFALPCAWRDGYGRLAIATPCAIFAKCVSVARETPPLLYCTAAPYGTG